MIVGSALWPCDFSPIYGRVREVMPCGHAWGVEVRGTTVGTMTT